MAFLLSIKVTSKGVTKFLLVACTRLYKPLCRSVGRSVGRSVCRSDAECSEHATYGDRPCSPIKTLTCLPTRITDLLTRLLQNRFRIEPEHGGSAISKGIEPEPFVHLVTLTGREPGIKLDKIPSRPRVLLFPLFLSKLAHSIAFLVLKCQWKEFSLLKLILRKNRVRIGADLPDEILFLRSTKKCV